MKKIIFLFIVILFIITLTGCSKKHKEPYFSLIYNGRTYMTFLAEYNNNSKKNYDKENLGTNYLRIKQNENLQYHSSPNANKVTLIIQRVDSKEKFKVVNLGNDDVDTSISQGKYIYTFNVVWENENAKFEILIQIG